MEVECNMLGNILGKILGRGYEIERLIRIATSFRHNVFEIDFFYCKNVFSITFRRADLHKRELTYHFNANRLNASELSYVYNSIKKVIRKIEKGWEFENLKNTVKLKNYLYADINYIARGGER